MAQPEESALVLLVPRAEPLVASFRARFDRSAARGMPAHITLLYPFRHPDRVSEDLVSELRGFFSRRRRFAFRLVGVSGFPAVVYLALEPLDPFDALTRDLASQYPDTPPYGGAFATPMPHLTVAQAPPADALEAVAADVLAAVSPHLPLQCEAREATLALKRGGRWSLGPAFALAG